MNWRTIDIVMAAKKFQPGKCLFLCVETTLVDACFPPSGDDNEYDRRMQVVEILLRRPSNIQGARCSSRPEPLIVLPS